MSGVICQSRRNVSPLPLTTPSLPLHSTKIWWMFSFYRQLIVQALWLPRGGYVKVRAIFKIFWQLSFMMSPKQHIKTFARDVGPQSIGMYLSIPSRDILSPKSKYCTGFGVWPHNDCTITQHIVREQYAQHIGRDLTKEENCMPPFPLHSHSPLQKLKKFSSSRQLTQRIVREQYSQHVGRDLSKKEKCIPNN